MTDGWPPRTARLLTTWTLLLLGLVLVEIRHLPPVLAALLVPYLALMTWHGVSGLRRRAMIGQDDGADSEAGSPGTAETTEMAATPVPDPDPASDDLPLPPRRGRTRRRPRTPETEPSAASWVQVQPGRFVRVEETTSPDQPDDIPPSDPGATQEAVLTPEVLDPEVIEPEVEVPYEPSQDTSGPEDQGEGSAAPSDEPDHREDPALGDPAGGLSRPGQAPES
jgi:hypothetical protein